MRSSFRAVMGTKYLTRALRTSPGSAPCWRPFLPPGALSKEVIAPARTLEICGQHCLERRGREAEYLRPTARANVVDLHRAHVVAGEYPPRQEFHDERLQMRKPGAEADDRPPAAGCFAGELDELAQRIHFRPAQFVSLSERVALFERVRDCASHVLDPYRLKARARRAERNDRKEGEQAREHAQKAVAPAEDH